MWLVLLLEAQSRRGSEKRGRSEGDVRATMLAHKLQAGGAPGVLACARAHNTHALSLSLSTNTQQDRGALLLRAL